AYRTVLDLAFRSRAPEIESEGRLFVKRDEEAGHHLLAVAAGLESMVLGEPEILGQVRQAADAAQAVGAAGPVLQRLLRAAAGSGRRSRAETSISTGAVSLGYAVVELSRNIFRELAEVRVLVLGAGETARLVVRNLLERGAGEVMVANRSPERAEALRSEVGGEGDRKLTVLPLDQRFEALASADVVVAATSAHEPLLTRAQVAAALDRRPLRPLLAVDLGVPRNIDPAAARLDNVFLHSIDSLQTLIDRNLKRRREEVPKVADIVGQELARFASWYRGLEVEPVVAQLQKQAEQIRRQELEQALAHFPPHLHEDLDRLTRAMVRKILHHPSTRLRSADAVHGLERLELVRDLFHLDEDEE
ncbi:MAG TPA: glutamyl-tRNA reductase, partial [Thermoanaerobaculia bacterium]|nr:glutamyl-tRNA reductase [Thermoanaerobaculia bacterium]